MALGRRPFGRSRSVRRQCSLGSKGFEYRVDGRCLCQRSRHVRAPRVSGQVANVFVEDNNVVRKGDLLIELDSEPYQVQVNIAQAAVDAAKAELVAAKAQVNGLQAQVRSYQFNMQHAIEDVHNKAAELRATIAELDTAKAKQARATADYQRALSLQKANPGAISRQDIDQYLEAYRVAAAQINQALEHVRQIRVSLGLPATPPSGDDLAQVPADLDQTFSGVREVQGKLMQAAAALGISGPFNKLPHEMEKDFFSRYPNQDIDQIFAKLLKDAPDIKRAETKLLQAERNLDQAKLNLRYCKVYARDRRRRYQQERESGQQRVSGPKLMAIRSLNEIWIDANFKETQLADLRIGQRVRCEVDMYGSRQEFEGRITGFTMGTGQTLSLLPPQNATGNFVKIVQRLPVRIELTDYDPEKAPLFVGAVGRRPTCTTRSRPRGRTPAKSCSRWLACDATLALNSGNSTNRLMPTRRVTENNAMSSSRTKPAAVEPSGGDQPLARRRRGRRAHVHGDPGHDDRERGPAVHRRRPVGRAVATPSGSSPATWPPTPSSCRSPAGCRPTSAAATTSCLSIAIFTLASALCGFATSLAQMILFRVIQGLAGGGLQPCSQGVLLDAFPPEKQGTAMTLFGVAAIIAPIIGPDARRLALRQLQLAMDLPHQRPDRRWSR